ncbi:hypothetical protein [Micromonospora sp. NPDC005413]|uniref:hypothetical protein n=1 Tax=Micromonospora sp. NPDC005413 TaxID=3154563 RepID=UPI0033A652E5
MPQRLVDVTQGVAGAVIVDLAELFAQLGEDRFERFDPVVVDLAPLLQPSVRVA